MTYVFDMDGTIANLYGVDGWLDSLICEDVKPYAEALPLVNMSRLARLIHKAQKRGDTVEIVSWLSKGGSADYNARVTETKLNWLRKHLPSVTFDNIYIVTYGTPKSRVTKATEAILFDDEERNRNEFLNKGFAFTPDKIFEVMERN